MKRRRLPRGWDEARVRRVMQHYERQTDAEAVAEDEAAHAAARQTVMIVPTEVVPAVRDLIAKSRARRTRRKKNG